MGVRELQQVCESTVPNGESQGEQINDTGLTLADWQPIYKALSQNQEPVLTPEQQKGLVDKGIVKCALPCHCLPCRGDAMVVIYLRHWPVIVKAVFANCCGATPNEGLD